MKYLLEHSIQCQTLFFQINQLINSSAETWATCYLLETPYILLLPMLSLSQYGIPKGPYFYHTFVSWNIALAWNGFLF